MFGLEKLLQKSIIKLVPATLSGTRVSLPVADIAGKAPGPTLLVTAGMDGDEYAGIEAAYAIIEKYKDGDFTGRLVVLPIVNIFGFEHESSHNPKDKKLPKLIPVGTTNGTSSEMLVHWLITTYASNAHAWIDLHGGALTEVVTPYVHCYTTGVVGSDTTTKNFHESLVNTLVLLTNAGRGSRARTLAQKGCTYILTESGGRGEVQKEDIEQHLLWVEALMQTLTMTPKQPASKPSQTVIRKIHYHVATRAGIFRPSLPVKHTVVMGDVMGAESTYQNNAVKNVVALQSGIVLWQKRTIAMRKGDILFAIGY